MTHGTIKAATVDSNNRSGKSAADNSKIGYADIITPQGAEIKTTNKGENMDNTTIKSITDALTINYTVGALTAAADALAPINDPAIKAIVDLIEATAYNKQLEADAVIKAALSIDPKVDIWDIAEGHTP